MASGGAVIGLGKSLAAAIHEYGAGWAALLALHRGLARLSGGRLRIVPYALMAQPLGQDAALRDSPGTVVRVVQADDPVTAYFPRPREVNLARWAAGARCHVAEVQGRFAGTIWTQRGRHEEDEVRCDYLLDPWPAVWDFDVYVEPRHRMGRTLARLWQAVDRDLRAEGLRWSFSRISRFNPGSVAAHARLGAVAVGHAVFIVCGPWQLALLTLRPWLHLSLSPRRRTPVRLRPPGAGGRPASD